MTTRLRYLPLRCTDLDRAAALYNHRSTPDDGSLDKGWVQITDPDGNHLVFEAASRPADPSTNPTG